MKLPTLRQLTTFFLAIGVAVGIYLICAATWQAVKDCPWCAAAAGAVLCGLCTALLQRIKKLHLAHGWDFQPRHVWIVVLGGIGIHWTGTAVEHWLMELLHHHYGWLAGCGLVLASISAALAYPLHRPRVLTEQLPPAGTGEGKHMLTESRECRPHLAWFLSSSGAQVAKEAGTGWVLRRPGFEAVPLPVARGLEALLTAVDPLKPWWNGQQLLRALAHQMHGGCLRDLWVLASTGPGGSSGERAALLNLLREVPELRSITIHPADNPQGCQELLVDYEDMAALQREVAALVRRTGDGRQFTLDCTGGQKTTSIAAALATVNNHALVQYVETRPPQSHPGANPINVRAYNCSIEHEAHPAGH